MMLSAPLVIDKWALVICLISGGFCLYVTKVFSVLCITELSQQDIT